jgi:hypothetical protein
MTAMVFPEARDPVNRRLETRTEELAGRIALFEERLQTAPEETAAKFEPVVQRLWDGHRKLRSGLARLESSPEELWEPMVLDVERQVTQLESELEVARADLDAELATLGCFWPDLGSY